MSLDFSRCRNVWVPDDSEAGGFWSSPLPHVKYGVEQILANPYFLLGDDMGGMKTAQAIISAQFLHEMNVIDRVIVVAPAAIRPKVWFDQDLGQLREQVWEDKRNFVSEYHARIKHWEYGPKDAKELRWIVTNFEFIRNTKNLAMLLRYCGPKTFLVLDESSAVRNWRSKQTQACMTLRWRTNAKGRPIPGLPRCGRILELNGTPVAESPMDMYSQMNLLHPSILDCKGITYFEGRYTVKIPVKRTNGTTVMSPYLSFEKQPDGSVRRRPQPLMTQAAGAEGWKNLDDLQRRCAPYILRREAKDLGIDFALPPVGLEVQLTPETWRVYREMKNEMVVWLESGVATAQQAGVKAIRLAQITSGFLGGVEDANVGDADGAVPDLFFDGVEVPKSAEEQHETSIWSGRASVVEVGREKLDFALEWQAGLLERYPDLKLLSWCRFVPELRRYLHEVKQKFGHPVGAACGEKVFIEEEWNQKHEREVALRLLHPKTAPPGACTVGATQGTGAMGLNFTACRTVLDMSYDYSPWKKKQGDARVNRPGQTGMVSFFYLIAVGPKGQKTIDHTIMMIRLGKMSVNDMTVAAWVKVLKEE